MFSCAGWMNGVIIWETALILWLIRFIFFNLHFYNPELCIQLQIWNKWVSYKWTSEREHLGQRSEILFGVKGQFKRKPREFYCSHMSSLLELLLGFIEFVQKVKPKSRFSVWKSKYSLTWYWIKRVNSSQVLQIICTWSAYPEHDWQTPIKQEFWPFADLKYSTGCQAEKTTIIDIVTLAAQ